MNVTEALSNSVKEVRDKIVQICRKHETWEVPGAKRRSQNALALNRGTLYLAEGMCRSRS